MVLAGCLLAAEPPATGTISGTVRFTGKVPEPKTITTTDSATIKHNDLIVDGKTKGLRYVFVQIEDAPPQPKIKKAKAVLIDQRDMIFMPRVVAVQHGQAVRFDNNDNCNHSVMAASAVAANQFNRFIDANQPFEHVFEPQKRPVLIGCSLHGWMRAWVYVVPHLWFAISDSEGRFQIAAVPPGKHTLLLTHPDTGLQERRMVQVEAGKHISVTVDWENAK